MESINDLWLWRKARMLSLKYAGFFCNVWTQWHIQGLGVLWVWLCLCKPNQNTVEYILTGLCVRSLTWCWLAALSEIQVTLYMNAGQHQSLSLTECFLSSVWHSQTLCMSPKYQTSGGEARQNNMCKVTKILLHWLKASASSPYGMTKIGRQACLEQCFHTCNSCTAFIYVVWTGETVELNAYQITSYKPLPMKCKSWWPPIKLQKWPSDLCSQQCLEWSRLQSGLMGLVISSKLTRIAKEENYGKQLWHIHYA